MQTSTLSQKDRKADIMAANEKFMDAFANGATTMSSLYTETAQLLPPNGDMIQGSDAAGTFWVGAYESGVKRAKLETMEAEQGGDQIVEVGRYTLYGDNDVQLDAGKYIVIWKQENGGWKLHRDIWNTSTPAS